MYYPAKFAKNLELMLLNLSEATLGHLGVSKNWDPQNDYRESLAENDVQCLLHCNAMP
jgi:hypothetical protein